MRAFIFFLLIQPPLLSLGQVVFKDVQTRLDEYNEHFQPEYVDVLLDKDTYFLGEHIWYSLSVSDQAYRTSSSSAVTYVELRDARDSVLIRQKIRTKNGVAHGDVPIPKYCPAGVYTVTAFTLWMKNSGPFAYERKTIQILDPDHLGTARVDSAGRGIMTIEAISDNTFQVSVIGNIKGDLIALTREELVFHQAVDGPGIIQLAPDVRGARHLFIGILDKTGALRDAQTVFCTSATSRIEIVPRRKVVRPREKIEFTTRIIGRTANAVPGTVNVLARNGIRQKADSRFQAKEFMTAILEFKSAEQPPLLFAKETILYPPTRNSLPARQNVNRSGFPLSSIRGSTTDNIQRDAMRWKMIQRFGIEPLYPQQFDYNVPLNFSFTPSVYAGISSFEDFIRETVSMVRIRKKGDEPIIRVRNSENPASIYFFKDAPLMLVDGFIVHADQLLSVPIHDISLINITWGSREINSMNIYSVADHGVISVITKSQYPIAGASAELFPGFHTPSSFVQNLPKNSEIPMLGDPVWWQPAVSIKDKIDVSFYADDEPGKIYIHVSGFTDVGEFVSGVEEISVVVD